MKQLMNKLGVKGNLKIKNLLSGGLITNYRCTSRCRHCLYNCGPHWPDQYIDRETAAKTLKIIRDAGCRSIHIGGGEPFLNVDGLISVLEIANEIGIFIDYVETNSSWFSDKKDAEQILSSLKDKGLGTILVSISPFHNEFIPFSRVKGVMETAQDVGLKIFPWVMNFASDLMAFDIDRVHAMTEFEEKFGSDYLPGIPGKYWIHLGGRSLNTFRPYAKEKSHDQIIKTFPENCRRELTDTTHFHLDLFGNYIPGLCSGLAIDAADIGQRLSEDKYPVITTLFQSGIKGLFEMATEQYSFQPARSGYINKCDLCTEIRTYLVTKSPATFPDLAPETFYNAI
jgi:hypothetical protein